MEDKDFRAGEQLWLRGQQVIFVEYHHYAAHRIGAAVVRRPNETMSRVVPLWKLARDRSESLARANAIPARIWPGLPLKGRTSRHAPSPGYLKAARHMLRVSGSRTPRYAEPPHGLSRQEPGGEPNAPGASRDSARN